MAGAVEAVNICRVDADLTGAEGAAAESPVYKRRSRGIADLDGLCRVDQGYCLSRRGG